MPAGCLLCDSACAVGLRPGGTRQPKNMIISPLEQFNVLSVYDFSLSNISNFETTYTRMIFLVWYTFYELPASCLDCVIAASADNPPIFGIAIGVFSTTIQTAMSIGYPIMHVLAQGVSNILVASGATHAFTLIDFIYGALCGLLSHVWFILFGNTNITYSSAPDYLFVFAHPGIWSGETPGPAVVEEAAVAGAYRAAFVGGNLSLLATATGMYLVHAYLAATEVLSGAVSAVWQQSFEHLFYLNTKDFSYLVFSLNTSTI